jgi:hypothetical protein
MISARLLLAPLLLAAACVAPIDYGAGPGPDLDAPTATTDGPPLDTPPLPFRDEDIDGLADPVDLCPTVFDDAQSQLDADHDGVGDGCDPQPGRANHLVLFAPFNKNDVEWISEGGTTWSIGQGVLETAEQSGDSGAYSPTTISGPVKVTASMIVVDRHGDVDVSLFDSYDPVSREGTECYVAQPAGSTGTTLVYSLLYMGDRNASERQTVSFPQGNLAAGSIIDISAQQDLNPTAHTPVDKRCTAANSNGMVSVARTYGAANDGTHLRVAARNANVAVRYVIAYSLSF